MLRLRRVPFDPEHLKQQLLFEPSLAVVWDHFMIAAKEVEFMRDGCPAKDLAVFRKIGQIAETVIEQLPGKVRFQSLLLFESVPGELYHGPVHLSSGLGNVFYFKSVNAGLFAVPTGLPQPNDNFVFARFSVDWKLKGMSAKVQ